MAKFNYSFIKVLTGSDLSSRRLAMMQVDSHNDGPIVWLTGCVHGDEIEGIIIIQEIFKRLKKEPLLKGQIYAFPLMNPLGFETVSRHITMSEEDLNRSFPGNKNGSLAERLADRIFTAIIKTKPTLVLDLHNDWLNSIPHCLLDPYPGLKNKVAWQKAKEFSLQAGFLIINEDEPGQEIVSLQKTLSGSLILHNIPALTLELGGASTKASIVSEKDVEDGIRSIWQVLAYLGMVKPKEGEFNFQPPKELKGKILQDFYQSVSSSGIIRFLAKPGDIVKKGQPLARVYNVFGKLQETVQALHDSIILGHTDYSVAYPGGNILEFGIIK
jgi:predicted deacylase